MDVKSRRMPTKKAIARYWNGRCLKCDEFCRELDHFRFRFDGGSDVLDDACADLVKCARCMIHLAPHNVADDAWSRVRADRAHILDRALWERGECPEPEGGIDGVNNLLLLCHECHRKDPMGRVRSEYMSWIIQERTRQSLAREDLSSSCMNGNKPSLAQIASMFPDSIDGFAEACHVEAAVAELRQRTPGKLIHFGHDIAY